MVNVRAFSVLLLLAPGAVSGALVENGQNTCLDKGHDDYSCGLSPGSLTIDMTSCGLVDSDLLLLDACIEEEGVKKEPITFIKLGNNSLSTLPENFFQPSAWRLSHLHLEENNLSMLPPKIFAGLSSLLKLHLQDNELTSLPSGLFDGLETLDEVDLSLNSGLQCAPSIDGTAVRPELLNLPADFSPGQQCECLPGGCEVDCTAGDHGYVCSADAGTTAQTASDPLDSPSATPVPTPSSTPRPVTADSGTPTPGTPNAALATPVPADDGGIVTETVTPEKTCSNGISGIQVGDVCCHPDCTQCGGVACGESAADAGLTAQDCCINQIIYVDEVCGGGVVAPCINYEPTPAPALPCSIQDTEDACKGDKNCLQCMYVTTIEQETAWKECFANYNTDVSDPCSPSTAMTCCLAEIEADIDCLEDELFMAYSECFVENSSGGADCPTPLMCEEATGAASVQEQGNAAGRLASPLNRVESLVVGMILALVGVAFVQ